MFRASSARRQDYLKLVRRPLVHVLSLQVSHHISLLGPELNACWEGIDLLTYAMMHRNTKLKKKKTCFVLLSNVSR